MEARLLETTDDAVSGQRPVTILIDGGGTSTDVAVLHSGQILSRTRLAPYKPDASGDRVDDLCRDLGGWLAGLSPEALVPRYILIGMSGVWNDHEKQQYLNAFTDAWMTYVSVDVPRTSVLSDVELVQLAAFGTDPGIVLIAGTGSIAVARSADHRVVRSGGWGPRIDDAGGGFWLGCEALRAVALSLDGRAPETLLIRPVSAFLRTDSSDPDRVAAALRRTPVDRAARLAEPVLTYADDGDAAAQQLRDRAIEALVELLPPLDAAMPDVLPVALHGSLFKHASFRSLMIERLHTVHPGRDVRFIADVIEAAAAALTPDDQ